MLVERKRHILNQIFANGEQNACLTKLTKPIEKVIVNVTFILEKPRMSSSPPETVVRRHESRIINIRSLPVSRRLSLRFIANPTNPLRNVRILCKMQLVQSRCPTVQFFSSVGQLTNFTSRTSINFYWSQ
jgi:hypothetical protein